MAVDTHGVRNRYAWLVVGCVVVLLLVILLWRTKAVLIPGTVSDEPASFLYRTEEGQITQHKAVTVSGGTLTASIHSSGISAPDGLLLGQGWPYVCIALSGTASRGGFVLDPDKISVQDSDGHAFRIVGVVPETMGSTCSYRYYLDALDFAAHVRFQKTDGWKHDIDEWKKRYTLRLTVPFRSGSQEHVLEIPRLAVFWRAGLPRSSGKILGGWPDAKINWDSAAGTCPPE